MQFLRSPLGRAARALCLLGLLCSALLSLQWHLYRRSSLLSLNDL